MDHGCASLFEAASITDGSCAAAQQACNPGAGELQRDEPRGADLCRGSVVVFQQSTQSCTTRNRPVAASGRSDGEEQPVAHAFMVAFAMVMLDQFLNRVTERAFANEDEPIQTRSPPLLRA